MKAHKRSKIKLPFTPETLEDVVLYVYDALAHFRCRSGDSAYAEASFVREGKKYKVRIEEIKESQQEL